ncbi:MAG: HDOD domain-containing protein [Sulfuricurvum sp.]|nr:HDOD domain-containing protein [Sulfuricurvum sp.]
MQDFFKQIINNIPPLPESVLKIEAYAKDPNVSYRQVSQMLEKDPVLTSEILKAANSPLYGISKKITSLDAAVSLFGLGTIRGFVLAVYVRKNFSFTLEPYDMTPEKFSLSAFKHHTFATNWYFESMPRLFNILSPATFLSNLGEVLITQYLIHENKSMEFKNAIQEDSDYKKAEHMFCSITAVELTAEVFEHWSMEERLVNTLRYCDNPVNAPAKDRLYAQILHCIHTVLPYNGVITEEGLKEALTLVEEYGLDLEKFRVAVEKAT